MIAALAMMAGATPTLACKDPQTQTDMNICAGRDHAKADVELNAQWTKTLAFMKDRDGGLDGLPGDGRPSYSDALLESQRAWLLFRDAQCQVEGFAMRGGSAESMATSACLADLTRHRTQQLKDLEQGY